MSVAGKLTAHCLLLLAVLLLAPAGLAQINTEDTETEGAGGGAGHSGGGESQQLTSASESTTTKTTTRKTTPTTTKTTPTEPTTTKSSGVVLDVVVSRMRNVSSGGAIWISCQVSPPGTFKTWLKDDLVISEEPSLRVGGDGSNIFGSYFCTADSPGLTSRLLAAQLVITEMPSDETTQEVASQDTQDVVLTCGFESRGAEKYRWYRYDDEAYRFKELTGEDNKSLVLRHATLNQDGGSGLTYYKCADTKDATTFKTFKVVKDAVKLSINGRVVSAYNHVLRQVAADVASAPLSALNGSRVTFVCPKQALSENKVTWLYRSAKTVSAASYSQLVQSSGVVIQDSTNSSMLTIVECDVKNGGYYRCIDGSVMRHVYFNVPVKEPLKLDPGINTEPSDSPNPVRFELNVVELTTKKAEPRIPKSKENESVGRKLRVPCRSVFGCDWIWPHPKLVAAVIIGSVSLFAALVAGSAMLIRAALLRRRKSRQRPNRLGNPLAPAAGGDESLMPLK